MAPKRSAPAAAGSPVKARRTGGGGSEEAAGGQAERSRALAREVIRLGDSGQNEAILSLLGDPVAPGCKIAVARKAFLRLSLLIHPDKLTGFGDATKAFQMLVAAFDRFAGTRSAPHALPEGRRNMAIGRSNVDCYRTEVLCPRCQEPWGHGGEGNPDYYYNFMMEGVRCFSCATCLFTFGCLSAVHKCPFCHGVFEYNPDQYHNMVSCGNRGCTQRFGFMMYHATDQAMSKAREAIREDFERKRRIEEAKQGRAARAARRSGRSDPSLEEKRFALGLADTCPRCGLALEGFEDGEQLRHLRSCKDTKAHAAHRAREKKRAKAAEAAEATAKAQNSVASGAMWNLAGARPEQLWMLDNDELRRRCTQEGLSTKGRREELVRSLAEHLRSRGAPRGIDFPKDLGALSATDLAAVCAAHGLPNTRQREACLEALEDLRTGVRAGSMPALEDGGRQGEARSARTLSIKDAPSLVKPTASGRPKATARPTETPMGRAKAKAKVKSQPQAKARSAPKAAPKAPPKAQSKAAAVKSGAQATAKLKVLLSKRRVAKQ